MADPLVEPREGERIAQIRGGIKHRVGVTDRVVYASRSTVHPEEGCEGCAAEKSLVSLAADLSRLQTVEAERDTALHALAEIAAHGCYHYHDPDSCLSEGEPEVCARCIAVAAAGEPRE